MPRRRAAEVVNDQQNLGSESVSVYEKMFMSLLRTPHAVIDESLQTHVNAMTNDPNFYAKLATWSAYKGNNTVRDINEIFIAVLFSSPFEEHREAAYVMLQNLPPYQVDRVSKYFTGYDEIRKTHSYEKSPVVNGKFGVSIEAAKYGRKHKDAGKPIKEKVVELQPKSALRKRLLTAGLISASDKTFSVKTLYVKHACLNKKRIKGELKRAITDYLRHREKDENISQMEGACLRAASSIKSLYARSRILPQNNEKGWINQLLFHGIAPEGTRIAALKSLSRTEDPTKQAEIIVNNKLPYPQVVSVLKNITPSVLVALVEIMSPQELLQNLNSIKQRGAFDNKPLKTLIDEKLKNIKTSKNTRIDALKASVAADNVLLDDATRDAVRSIADTQIKRHGSISVPTLLMIDKSGSMTNAIEIGKFIAAGIAQACKENNKPLVYLFDSQSVPIVWNERDGDITLKSNWDKKLKTVTASGGTQPERVLSALNPKNPIEQIVIITDEDENNSGAFSKALVNYSDKSGTRPNIVIIRVGIKSKAMTESLKKDGFTVDAIEADKVDSVSMPNLLQILSRKSVGDLIQEIFLIDIPTKSEIKS